MFQRDRYLGEGEESPWTKILVVLGFLVLIGVGGTIAVTFWIQKQVAAALDPDTFCPKAGPDSVTSVLIDRTDGINDVQAQALKNLIVNWVHDVPTHGAFKVYEVVGGTGLPAPILSLCNPGKVEDVDVFTGNKRLTKERYEAKFMQPIEALIAGMLTDKEAPSSPIMEAVQAIAVRDFSNQEATRRLIIVSDLMQRTAEFSLYKQAPAVQDFIRSPYGRRVEASLRGIETRVYLMRSSSQKQTSETVQFWLDWLTLQGADLLGQFKVPG